MNSLQQTVTLQKAHYNNKMISKIHAEREIFYAFC